MFPKVLLAERETVYLATFVSQSVEQGFIRNLFLNVCCEISQVSIFLKDKVQTPNGRFVLPTDGQVPWDTETPGAIM